MALCLHGFPAHAEMWRHHIDTLVKLGYRVWAPNQRGYGKSSKPAAVSSYHVDHLVADVAALIDASGARETTLIAHDWGALVAWFFAMRGLRPLRRLIVMNVPHPAIFAHAMRTNWTQRLRSWYALAFQIPLLPEWLISRGGGERLSRVLVRSSLRPDGFLKEELAIYRTQIADRQTARAMISWYRCAVRSNVMLTFGRYGIPRIDVPTLVLWGEDDRFLGKETTYGTDRYVRDLRIDYLAGCSHWVSQDARERANERIADFLRRDLS